MSSRPFIQGLLALLCGAALASCAKSVPSNAEEASDDAGVIEPAPDEPEPKAWAPYTVEEARALRDSFRWEDTVALPEEPLAQRTPGAMEKASLDPISQIISSMVSLYYVQIYVNNADQLRELDEMFIHWDMAPLFESELPTGEVSMTFEGDPKDGGGMFVYAFMPAITYNLIRTAALFGEDTYKAMPMRTVPLEARAWDGSVKWEYLGGVLMSYAPERTHLTDDGETPFPSVLDAEEVVTSADGAQQKRFGRRLRKWARKTRDAVRTVVDTVRKGVGELQKLVNKDITLTINMPVKVRGPFTKTQRAWDQFGQFVPTFGKELTLHNTRVNVTQLGGISLFQTQTDNGVVKVKVPKSRWTRVCIEADSPAARMESGLLWPMRQCFPRFRPSSSGSRTFTVSMQEFYSLMLMQDSRVFADDVLGHKPPKATVQVGWPADGIGLINNARPFVPCLEATKGPVTVFNSIVDALTAIAGPAGNTVGEAAEFVLTSDIVMPSATNRLRVQPVHEYGHYFFCTLINKERAQTFNVVWSQFMTSAFLERENDVNYMMEGFAEWFASQVAGGVDYFPMVNGTEFADSDYLFIPGQTAKGFGLEENVGSALCGTSGALPFPKCQTTKIARLQFEDRKEEGIATFATLLHDIIDRKSPRQCAGAGCFNERTSSAAVWKKNTSSNVFQLVNAPAGTWGGEVGDETIELPANEMVVGIRAFANKNWAFGAALSEENLMVPIIEQMYVYGNSKEDVCELFKLHRRNNTCPSWVPDDPFDGPGPI